MSTMMVLTRRVLLVCALCAAWCGVGGLAADDPLRATANELKQEAAKAKEAGKKTVDEQDKVLKQAEELSSSLKEVLTHLGKAEDGAKMEKAKTQPESEAQKVKAAAQAAAKSVKEAALNAEKKAADIIRAAEGLAGGAVSAEEAPSKAGGMRALAREAVELWEGVLREVESQLSEAQAAVEKTPQALTKTKGMLKKLQLIKPPQPALADINALKDSLTKLTAELEKSLELAKSMDSGVQKVKTEAAGAAKVYKGMAEKAEELFEMAKAAKADKLTGGKGSQGDSCSYNRIFWLASPFTASALAPLTLFVCAVAAMVAA